MTLGQEITDSASVSVTVSGQTVTGSITSTFTYVEHLDSYDTGLGPVEDVLHLTAEIGLSATLELPFPLPPVEVDLPLVTSEFFLARGLGMIAHDQNADLNDAERQVADMIRIGGSDMEPPARVYYSVILEPVEGPGEGVMLAAASGIAEVTVDTVNNILSYNITYSDLSSAETAAHIHGFAPPGQTADPLHTLPLGTPKVGQWDYTEDQQYGILAGLTYINIHTVNNPGGEIRGQIAGGEVIRAAVTHWMCYQ
jgi:hypothetical protein